MFAILSVTYADVSHLNGYQYPSQNLGTAALKLHSVESPASTQYHATYGSGGSQLPSSYVPPASGSPFDSSAPSPKTYPSATLAAPFNNQRSLFNTNYQTQTASAQYQQPAKQYLQPVTQYQKPATQYQKPVTQYQQPATQYQQPTAQYQQQYQQPARQYQQQYQQPSTQYQPPVYQTSAQTATQYNTAQASQEPIITKHFYVHAAPEDPEEETGPRFIPVGRPRKTYKIIFIKTPTYGLKSQIIPVLPQNEEKTIVYVLSKKPTFDQNIQLPEPAATEPTKPEVFFVKYKTQEEADRAQKEIQGKLIHSFVNCIIFNITVTFAILIEKDRRKIKQMTKTPLTFSPKC